MKGETGQARFKERKRHGTRREKGKNQDLQWSGQAMGTCH